MVDKLLASGVARRRPSESAVRALALLVRYLTDGNIIGVDDLASELDLEPASLGPSGQDSKKQALTQSQKKNLLQNFMNLRSEYKYFHEIKDVISKHIEARRILLPQWLLPVQAAALETLDPDGGGFSSPELLAMGKMFAPRNLTVNAVDKIVSNYAGNYHVLRYAAHRMPEEVASSKRRHSSNRPSIMRAVLQIHSDQIRSGQGPTLPKFTIHYKPFEATLPVTIDGLISPIDELLYFIGHEGGKYPLVVVVQNRDTKVNPIHGIVLRRHVDFMQPFAARVLFVRAEVFDVEEEIAKVGLYSDNDPTVIDLISRLGLDLNQIKNAVEPAGRGVLKIWLPPEN